MRIQISDGNNSRSELEGRDELPHLKNGTRSLLEKDRRLIIGVTG